MKRIRGQSPVCIPYALIAFSGLGTCGGITGSDCDAKLTMHLKFSTRLLLIISRPLIFCINFVTRSVGGVHGGDGDADSRGAEEGDGELGEVGDDHAEDVALLGPHPQEAAAKLLDHRVRHLVRVLAPVETAYLNTWVWKFISYVTDALMRVWEGSKHCNRLFSLFEFPFSLR